MVNITYNFNGINLYIPQNYYYQFNQWYLFAFVDIVAWLRKFFLLWRKKCCSFLYCLPLVWIRLCWLASCVLRKLMVLNDFCAFRVVQSKFHLYPDGAVWYVIRCHTTSWVMECLSSNKQRTESNSLPNRSVVVEQQQASRLDFLKPLFFRGRQRSQLPRPPAVNVVGQSVIFKIK